MLPRNGNRCSEWKWFPGKLVWETLHPAANIPCVEDMCCLISNLCHSLLVMGPMLLGHYSLLAFHMVLVAIHPGKTAGHTTFCSGNISVSARIVALQDLKDGNPELAGMRWVVEWTSCTDIIIQLPFKLHLFGLLFNTLLI